MSSNPVAARLSELVSVGLLTASVPRVVVDEAVGVFDRGARRCDGALPPHVMVYFAVAMALFPDEGYEGVFEHLAGALVSWGGWEDDWQVPTSGGIAKARARLGFEPLRYVFEQVAQPVAEIDTRGGWLGRYRLVSIDGMVLDLPDSDENQAVFGRISGAAFPQARVVTLVESGSHCVIGARIGPAAGKGSGEQTAARDLVDLLDADMLCLADRLFYGFDLWCAGADTGAGLLWRIKDTVELPLVADAGDGSYTSLVFAKNTSAGTRARLLGAARAGRDIGFAADQARLVRVVQYYVNGRDPRSADRELICLITNLCDPSDVPAAALAAAYHDRWEHEGANAQIKTGLRGPGRVLRSKTPDMVRQEIYGYLLAHYAITALICKAATETDTDPDRIRFTKAVRLARAHISDPEAFSP